MTWKTAHRTAMIRAVQAHRDLEVDTSSYVDVYQALRRAGVVVMAQPMDIFAVYLPATGITPAGVLINSDRDDVVQRHSAAHEIGHHLFDHAICLDDGSDPFDDPRPRKWPFREKQAEAFAAWFLMPRRAVTKAMAAVGLQQVEQPDDAYQVALHLGTSYKGTVRHLANLNLITHGQAAQWAKVTTTVLRRRAHHSLGGAPPGRVWTLGPQTDGAVIRVRPKDRLVVTIGSRAATSSGETCDLPVGVSRVPPSASALTPGESGNRQVFEITAELAPRRPARFTTYDQENKKTISWKITLAAAPTLVRGLHSSR